ncbi:MAG TPA: tripartite tricarboxylate transporter substrate binding protein [Burkholderiales bacterium]|nr:tripartite tricarboxylate transporter substrate binding protein [Burkholderiales bacterium]
MQHTFRRFLATLSGMIVCVMAAAQPGSYPTRPLRMVIPNAPGGSSDFVARILQPKMSELLGVQVIIDNRGGASGNIGVEVAGRAAPDGYTLLLGNVGAMAINPHLFPKFPLHPLRDFTCVTTVVDVAGALAIHPSLPVSNLKEFVDYAKARPGKLSYGSSNPGAAQSLVMEYIKLKNNLDILRVDYKGGAGPATIGLLAGEVQAAMATGASYVGHVKAGKLKMLAVVSPKRIAAAPDVPTMVELGYPELTTGSWQALYVPAGTPREPVHKLHETLLKTLKDSTVVERLAGGGADVITSKSPEDCAAFMKTQLQFWGPIVKRVGLTPG